MSCCWRCGACNRIQMCGADGRPARPSDLLLSEGPVQENRGRPALPSAAGPAAPGSPETRRSLISPAAAAKRGHRQGRGQVAPSQGPIPKVPIALQSLCQHLVPLTEIHAHVIYFGPQDDAGRLCAAPLASMARSSSKAVAFVNRQNTLCSQDIIAPRFARGQTSGFGLSVTPEARCASDLSPVIIH